MIDIEVIKEKAAKRGVPEIVVEKDYIQDWLLWGISQIPQMCKNFVFKGGTALHKFYFPDWRFSEDLDFTTIHRVYKKEITELIVELCRLIQRESDIYISLKKIESSGKENEEWSFEAKLEYIGPRKQSGGDLPIVVIHITNDELLIDKPYLKSLLTAFPDINRDFSLLTYSPEEIFAEKLRTVLHQRCWPRDVYDLWRLFKEIGSFIDMDKVFRIYEKKCLYRDIDPGMPEKFDPQILRLRDSWVRGLQRQIQDIPEFNKIQREIKEMINGFFSKKKGGTIMVEIQYRIKYKKDNIEIEVQGDKEFVENKLKELLSLASPLASKEETVPVIERKTPLSIGELLNMASPKTHGDKILTFAYYLEHSEGLCSFNLGDIERCYQTARIPKTKNISQYISWLIRKGYLMDAPEKKDGKKAWMLTGPGGKYVENLISRKR